MFRFIDVDMSLFNHLIGQIGCFDLQQQVCALRQAIVQMDFKIEDHGYHLLIEKMAVDDRGSRFDKT